MLVHTLLMRFHHANCNFIMKNSKHPFYNGKCDTHNELKCVFMHRDTYHIYTYDKLLYRRLTYFLLFCCFLVTNNPKNSCHMKYRFCVNNNGIILYILHMLPCGFIPCPISYFFSNFELLVSMEYQNIFFQLL